MTEYMWCALILSVGIVLCGAAIDNGLTNLACVWKERK